MSFSDQVIPLTLEPPPTVYSSRQSVNDADSDDKCLRIRWLSFNFSAESIRVQAAPTEMPV